jgi:hypothetical protein
MPLYLYYQLFWLLPSHMMVPVFPSMVVQCHLLLHQTNCVPLTNICALYLAWSILRQ